MKSKILGILMLTVVLLMFVGCELYGNKDLGNKITLWARDSAEGQFDLVYCGSSDIGGCISGIYMLPENQYDKYTMYVETAKSNDKWVIARSVNINDQSKNYWIIDKNFSLDDVDCNKSRCDSIIQLNVAGAFDLKDFKIRKQELDINLKFD